MKRTITIILTLLMFTIVGAQTAKELRKQQEEVQKQLAETQKMLNETKRNETATVNKLNLLSKDIKSRKKLINSINQELNALEKEREELQVSKLELESEQKLLKEDYAVLVRETHYAQMKQSPLLFLLSSEDFNQLIRRMRYMQQFASYRKEQVNAIKLLQVEIDEQDSQLKQNSKQKLSALQQQQRQQEQLARDEKKQKAMLGELKKKEKDLIAQQKRQQKKADELNKKLDDLINKDVKKSANSLTKEEQLVAGGFAKNKGRLPWPTEKGFISGQFGVQPHPTLQHITINNRGVYIQTTTGSNARAVFEGEVSAVFQNDGQNVVIIKHGNYRTVYSNLTTLFVKTGDKVDAKQKIGKIYTDPQNDNKTELFFQVRKDTEVLNPSHWLTKQ